MSISCRVYAALMSCNQLCCYHGGAAGLGHRTAALNSSLFANTPLGINLRKGFLSRNSAAATSCLPGCLHWGRERCRLGRRARCQATIAPALTKDCLGMELRKTATVTFTHNLIFLSVTTSLSSLLCLNANQSPLLADLLNSQPITPNTKSRSLDQLSNSFLCYYTVCFSVGQKGKD